MNKTVVIYQSKYGTTKKYAEWISQELSCEIFERKQVQSDNLKDYTTIIYGGGLYAGGVSGINLIVKSFNKIKDKNIILFTCGLADPSNAENTDHIKDSLKKILSPEMQEKIVMYHLRGGIDYSKLGIVHKSMMAMLRKMLTKKDYMDLSEEDKQMLDTYGQIVDFTDKSAIEPMLNFVRTL